MYCTNCGTELGTGRFCTNCGTPRPEASPANALPARPEPPPAVVTPAPRRPLAPFAAAEREFARLRDDFDRGVLQQAQFESALDRLIVVHEGRQWAIGANSGTWFVDNGQDWVETVPPSEGSGQFSPAATVRTLSPGQSWTTPVLDHVAHGVAFLPGNDRVLITLFDPVAPVYAIGGDVTGSLQVPDEKFLLDCAAVSGNGARLVCSGVGRTVSGIFVWDNLSLIPGAPAAPQRTIYRGPTLTKALALSGDGTRLVVGTSSSQVVIFDLTAGHVLQKIPVPDKTVSYVVCSTDGRYAAAASTLFGEGTTRVFDVETAALLHQWRDERIPSFVPVVSGLRFSADGRRLGVVNTSRLLVYDVHTGRESLAIEPPAGRFSCVAFSPDGSQVITGGGSEIEKDFAILVWDIHSGQQIERLVGHTDRVNHLVMSGDGRYLASAAADKTVRVWARR